LGRLVRGKTTSGGWEDRIVPAIVQFPTVVQEALEYFGPLFANAPEREHLGEYLTGLLVAQHKSVLGIHREFADTTDPSCLNRWLTEAHWDAPQLNRMRLRWLQQDPATRYSPRGVIPLDNVLINHEGQLIEDVGWFWDHAEDRYQVAHDYLIVHYVCPSGQHYPLEYRRFIKQSQCQERQRAFRDHHELFRELVDWCVQEQIPGTFSFDSWFTNAENLNHIHTRHRAYVGDLKFNRKVIFQGQELRAEQLAAGIGPQDRRPIAYRGSTQWYFTKTVRIPKVDHPVRLLILWKERTAPQPCKILLSNQTRWEVHRLQGVYQGRWRGTECFRRDGKQNLGMGACQVRNGQGQTRHMYLVFLSHSLLMRVLQRRRPCAWALERLMTIGQACWAVLRETLSHTIGWALDRLQVDHWSRQQIKQQLELP
jgi:hypothetical protein